MGKPIGPICNLDCTYCFYLEKEQLYPDQRTWRMSRPVLEAYIRQYIGQQDAAEINFTWQGGEPTLLGVDFFREAVELQQRYADGKAVHNSIQTNGTLLDDEWGDFLARHHFLVGLSIDGPRALHDAWRVDKHQQPTFDAVMRGLDVLKKHAVEFNTLTVVNSLNSEHPGEVYAFLKQIGSSFIQFIPVVERRPARVDLTFHGAALAEPPSPADSGHADVTVTDWSVRPEAYGEFLVQVFDQWVRNDVGSIFVQHFDVALGNWLGIGSSLCVFAPTCGSALAIEHNGDVYSCDHYVYPKYRLGNVLTESLGDMVASGPQRRFGRDKQDTLPAYCRRCEVRFACNGECPKHRFTLTPDGEAGLNYLCPAYKRFFGHIDPYMKIMADLLRAGRPAADIMQRGEGRGI
ncbi:MAG: radical sulfatase maturation protein [Phycisphaerales bacterium]|nr:radical sulfatase maturation protein [Phycisphaerales bacterium]